MPLTVEGEEFYTMREACAVLDIKPATLYAYVSRGLLTSYRQGIKRRRLYRKSEVDSLLTLDRGGRAAPAAESTTRTSQAKGRHIPPAESWIGYT